ncbi:hypothetical protein [Fictibacillus barbaricus]|uniref:Uncharacterized protein n=1 Tax=Fictibacillus barbaricus TaxID=182136 RepID=A0ABU1U1L3_9BACL|nr:hypothetical protein [Fictibacillus barbaricus]MDR7073338.1 hypothetical protein [Fictibacillus barbaricus]
MELKRTRRNKKMYAMIKLLIAIYCLIIMSSKYDTYAWLSAKSSAEGTIKNATTSDLLKITYGDVKYSKNCKVKTTITVKNISDLDIPIKLTNVFGIPFPIDSIESGKSISSEFNGRAPLGCEATSVNYHLIGFKGYIDEDLSIPLDHEKLIATIQKDKTEATNEDQPKDKSDNSKTDEPKPEGNNEESKKDEPQKDTGNEEKQPAPEDKQGSDKVDQPTAEPINPDPNAEKENNSPANPPAQNAEQQNTESKDDPKNGVK